MLLAEVWATMCPQDMGAMDAYCLHAGICDVVAEIEKLRAELKEVNDVLSLAGHNEKRLILQQRAEIKRLLFECQRLRIKCGPDEMVESDYIDIEEVGDE